MLGEGAPWICSSKVQVFCCVHESIAKYVFETLQKAGFGQQSEESAPQQCSAVLFVDPPFIERPTPFIGQEELVSNPTASYTLHPDG